MKKRILSMVLAILMIVTLIPAYAVSDTRQQTEMQASAAEESEPQSLAASTDLTAAAPQSAAAESGEADARASTLKTAARAASSDIKYEVEGGYIYFNESTGAITGCDKTVTKAVIPSEINGVSVTSIANRAFYGCTSLTNIVIPDSVTSIANYAFRGCTNLKKLQMPITADASAYDAPVDGYTQYPSFYGCNSIEEITFTAGSTGIPGKGVSNGSYLFSASTSKLKSIKYEEGIKSIPRWAFRSCKGLTSVTIPDSVTDISGEAFYDCTGLTSIVIPNGVTKINGSTFYGCTSLSSVTIPYGVTSIANMAFYGCTSLTDVVIPDSVTSIANYAFRGCTNLKKLQMPITADASAYDAPVDGYTQYPSFYGCNSIEEITFTAGSTGIPGKGVSNGSYLFSASTSKLKSIKYEEGIKSIPRWAARSCKGLTSVTIPDSVTDISAEAFYGCTGLTSIVIPNSVESIGVGAFSGCEKLESVHYAGNREQWEKISIGNENEPLAKATIYLNGLGNKANLNNKLTLSGISPNHSTVSENEKFILTFNDEVELNAGYIEFHRIKGNSPTFKLEIGSDTDIYKVSKKTISVDISSLDLPDGSYYVTISPKAFKTKNGTYYYGLANEKTWEFELCNSLNNDIMEYGKSGHLFWKSDDTSKPAIPSGTDDQYAALILQLAINNGIGNLTEENIKSVLNKPMYLLATDKNESVLKINDKSTTVKQTLEDILFFESLRPFAQSIDKNLNNIVKFNELSGMPTSIASSNRLVQEESIYEDVLSWYSQINKYCERRNGNSNIFYSAAAPIAYSGLLAIAGAEEYGYSYVSPLIEAQLDNSILEKYFSGLDQYSKYSDFKNAAEEAGTALKAVDCVYKGISEGARAGVGAAIRLRLDMLKLYFKDSDNSVLNEIGETMGYAGDFKSAWQCCLFLGSSVGALPMVIDLYNDMYEGVKNTVAASYFLSDYYIREKYPSFYAACFDENGFPSKYNAFTKYDFSDIVASDPIVYNWCAFMDGITEGAMHEDCRQLRYDLVNYIMLLKYAKDFNAAAAKSALIKYISAECNKGKPTEFYTSCPVSVEVYDSETDQLFASLSSEDGSIPACEYVTMYLMGENNETKCFVFNEGSYYAKIIPYDDGTMNVGVITSDGTDTAEGKIFSKVSLTAGSEFVLDLNDMQSGLNTADGEEVAKDGYIPTSDAEISGANEVAVGSEITLAAKVLPSIASNKNVSWSSSDPTVAEVDDTGVVRGISEGKATIILTCEDGVTREVEVSVFIPANSLSLSKNQLKMVCGEKIKISTETNENASHKIRWVSNNINVVTVGADGEIYAKAAGDAIVTASIDGIEDDICIRVYDTQFGVEMYQGDDGGNRINILMTNNSCTDTLNKTAYAAIYESGRMIDIQSIAVNIECGEEASRTVLLGDFATGKTYSAVFYTIGETAQPDSVKEIVLVNGDYDAAADTEEALNELPDCHKMPIECNDLIAGAEYTLYVLTDNEGVLTENNIAYIAKRTANAEQNTFVVSLANKFNGKQCYAYIVENNGDLREVTSFEQHEHRYENGKCTICGLTGVTWIPGDLNGDGKVNVMDLIRLKRYLADGTEVVGNADVNGDGKVNVMDLIRLKRYIAGEAVDIY